jgi:hypothetical protein
LISTPENPWKTALCDRSGVDDALVRDLLIRPPMIAGRALNIIVFLSLTALAAASAREADGARGASRALAATEVGLGEETPLESDTEFFEQALGPLFDPNDFVQEQIASPEVVCGADATGVPYTFSDAVARVRRNRSNTARVRILTVRVTVNRRHDCVSSTRAFLMNLGYTDRQAAAIVPQLSRPIPGNPARCVGHTREIGARCKGEALLAGNFQGGPLDELPGRWRVASARRGRYDSSRNGVVYYDCPGASSWQTRRYGHVGLLMDGLVYDNDSRPCTISEDACGTIRRSSEPQRPAADGSIFHGTCRPTVQVWNEDWNATVAPRELAGRAAGSPAASKP